MEKTLVELRRELDEAQNALIITGQYNVASCVLIEARIDADRAHMAAQRRMSEAYTAYMTALSEYQATRSPLLDSSACK